MTRLAFWIAVCVMLAPWPPALARSALTDADRALFADLGDMGDLAACAQQDGGPVEVYTGLATILNLGAPALRGGTLDPGAVDITVLPITSYAMQNGRMVPIAPDRPITSAYIVGKAAGTTPLLLIGPDNNPVESRLLTIRAIEEGTARPAHLYRQSCTGPEGDRLELQIGADTTLDLDQPFAEISSSNGAVAEVRPLSNTRVLLHGVQSGWTTLTAISSVGTVQENCLVHVREHP